MWPSIRPADANKRSSRIARSVAVRSCSLPRSIVMAMRSSFQSKTNRDRRFRLMAGAEADGEPLHKVFVLSSVSGEECMRSFAIALQLDSGRGSAFVDESLNQHWPGIIAQ